MGPAAYIVNNITSRLDSHKWRCMRGDTIYRRMRLGALLIRAMDHPSVPLASLSSFRTQTATIAPAVRYSYWSTKQCRRMEAAEFLSDTKKPTYRRFVLSNGNKSGDGDSAVLGGFNRRNDYKSGAKGPRFIHRYIADVFSSLFLPKGYPDSVTEDYLEYQAWDTIQALCSYLRGVLATKAWFEGVGVGRKDASAAGATLQWILKDGCGMVGSLFFASTCGRKFDANVKAWRLFADLINNVGLFLDMLAPLAGRYFLFVVCCATVCKAMCGVAAGATKAALTGHFALRNNAADVQAKESSQETFVTLLGLVAGSLLASSTHDTMIFAWMWFIGLTIVHVFANYNGVRALLIPTLNETRLELVFERFISAATAPDEADVGVRAISKIEPLFTPLLDSIHYYRVRNINIGVSWEECITSKEEWKWMRELYTRYKGEKYLLNLSSQGGPREHGGGSGSSAVVNVVVFKDAKAEDIYRAYFQGLILLRSCKKNEKVIFSRVQVETSYKAMTKTFASFQKCVRDSGWDMKTCLIGGKYIYEFHLSES
eukprot:jgi/Bigna1/87403/estExt_fgenesh1_pg.C_200033